MEPLLSVERHALKPATWRGSEGRYKDMIRTNTVLLFFPQVLSTFRIKGLRLPCLPSSLERGLPNTFVIPSMSYPTPSHKLNLFPNKHYVPKSKIMSSPWGIP